MPPLVITAAHGHHRRRRRPVGWLVVAPRDRTHEQVLANTTHGLPTAAAARHTRRTTGRTRPQVGTAQSHAQTGPASGPRRPTPRLDLDRVLLAKLLLPVAAASAGLLFVTAGSSPGRIMLVAVVTAVTFFVPDLLLLARDRSGRKRSVWNSPTPWTR